MCTAEAMTDGTDGVTHNNPAARAGGAPERRPRAAAVPDWNAGSRAPSRGCTSGKVQVITRKV